MSRELARYLLGRSRQGCCCCCCCCRGLALAREGAALRSQETHTQRRTGAWHFRHWRKPTSDRHCACLQFTHTHSRTKSYFTERRGKICDTTHTNEFLDNLKSLDSLVESLRLSPFFSRSLPNAERQRANEYSCKSSPLLSLIPYVIFVYMYAL